MLEQNAVHDDDAWGAASHNDTLMEAEYLDDLRRSQLDPERRLMLAILQDAVACYRRNSGTQLGKRRQLFLEVENWIKDRQHESLFSFSNVCDTLGINPDYVTRGLCREWDSDADVPEIRYLRLQTSSRRRSRRKTRKTPSVEASI